MEECGSSKNCRCPFTLSPRAQHPFWQLNNSTPLQKNKLRPELPKAFIGNGAKTNTTLWSFSQIKGHLLSICARLPAGPSLCVSGIHTCPLLFCGSAQENPQCMCVSGLVLFLCNQSRNPFGSCPDVIQSSGVNLLHCRICAPIPAFTGSIWRESSSVVRAFRSVFFFQDAEWTFGRVFREAFYSQSLEELKCFCL